jgi:hypothetical protein
MDRSKVIGLRLDWFCAMFRAMCLAVISGVSLNEKCFASTYYIVWIVLPTLSTPYSEYSVGLYYGVMKSGVISRRHYVDSVSRHSDCRASAGGDTTPEYVHTCMGIGWLI